MPGRVFLPHQFLKVGPNEAKINFANKYRNDGNGLHSFTDHADNLQYIYTKLEPSYCHYVFPNFDQPNLKANWTLKAVVPDDWLVISNEIEDNASATNKSKEYLKQKLGDIANNLNLSKVFAETNSMESIIFR